MRNQYTSVRGVTDVVRMPRLGKIHLGVKVNNGMTEYPKETKYFVCPAEVRAVYGEEPIELDVVFPIDKEEAVFPQAYKLYMGPSLRCKGDGETALRVAGYLGAQKDTVKGQIPAEPTAMVEIPCPCPLLDKDSKGRSKCNLVGSLSFMLPKVSIAGVYQIDMRGANSILNLNSALALTRSLAGRISMIPFKLKRVPQQLQYQDKTSTHYILRLDHQLTAGQIRSMRGDQFMLGFSADNPDPGPPPAGAVEDIPPVDPNAKKIEVFIKDVLLPEEGKRDYYIITGQEDPGEATPILEFNTMAMSHAQIVWDMAKQKCTAMIKYVVTPAGNFEIVSIEKGMPF